MVSDGVAVDLELVDTAGEEDLKRFRSFSYLETDIFIICYSVVSPKTLKSVVNTWIPEIKEYWTNKPFILVGQKIQTSSHVRWLDFISSVGTKSDLRNNIEIRRELSITNEKPIGRHYGRKLASKYGAITYIECSAATKLGVRQVFDQSIRTALDVHLGKSLRQNCITCAIMWDNAVFSRHIISFGIKYGFIEQLIFQKSRMKIRGSQLLKTNDSIGESKSNIGSKFQLITTKDWMQNKTEIPMNIRFLSIKMLFLCESTVNIFKQWLHNYRD